MGRRRALAGGATVVVPVVLVAGFGHSGQHMVRNLLLPGAGLYDEHPVIGVGLTALAVVATVAWFRWGVDWSVAAVVVAAVVVSGLLAEPAHPDPDVSQAAHEFPLVILVVGALGWARTTVRRLPLVSRLRLPRRPDRRPAPVDRCRAAAVGALTGSDAAILADLGIDDPDVVDRARRVNLVARGRRGGDPLRVDHAHTRAALALCDRLDDARLERFRADAATSWSGVPASEPGWVRLLDGTLAALALGGPAADRWQEMLTGPMRLHRGHRPAWTWTPLGISSGRADDWEHAAATVLARRAGWLGDDDWEALRKPALGAAARGVAHPDDERLVAAGRAWASLVGDDQATRLLARPTVRRDPIAVALDRLATEGINA